MSHFLYIAEETFTSSNDERYEEKALKGWHTIQTRTTRIVKKKFLLRYQEQFFHIIWHATYKSHLKYFSLFFDALKHTYPSFQYAEFEQTYRQTHTCTRHELSWFYSGCNAIYIISFYTWFFLLIIVDNFLSKYFTISVVSSRVLFFCMLTLFFPLNKKPSWMISANITQDIKKPRSYSGMQE